MCLWVNSLQASCLGGRAWSPFPRPVICYYGCPDDRGGSFLMPVLMVLNPSCSLRLIKVPQGEFIYWDLLVYIYVSVYVITINEKRRARFWKRARSVYEKLCREERKGRNDVISEIYILKSECCILLCGCYCLKVNFYYNVYKTNN